MIIEQPLCRVSFHAGLPDLERDIRRVCKCGPISRAALYSDRIEVENNCGSSFAAPQALASFVCICRREVHRIDDFHVILRWRWGTAGG